MNNKLSNEEINIYKKFLGDSKCSRTHLTSPREIIVLDKALTELLARREAESKPVAWVWNHPTFGQGVTTSQWKAEYARTGGANDFTPLYASPALSQPVPRGVKFDWVDCPICNEPDMQRETDSEGNSLIYCLNHGCTSNNPASPVLSQPVQNDYFASLVNQARTSADKAMRKFPQPNYVLLKVAEEAGEVVQAGVHYSEGRMTWGELEGEIVQLLAMLIRLVTEGDQVNGITPPTGLCVSPVLGQTPALADALEAAQKRIAELEASQPVVPEGWKLVPTEATRSIIDAFKASWEKDDSYAEYWERMVNAAPALQEE